MSPIRTQSQPIRSSLAADPELQELLAQFVDEMPSRVALLQRHFDAGDWEAMRTAAHRLKGAAGSYGFEPLVPCALRLETLLLHQPTRAEIGPAFFDLVARCRRVTAEPAR